MFLQLFFSFHYVSSSGKHNRIRTWLFTIPNDTASQMFQWFQNFEIYSSCIESYIAMQCKWVKNYKRIFVPLSALDQHRRKLTSFKYKVLDYAVDFTLLHTSTLEELLNKKLTWGRNKSHPKRMKGRNSVGSTESILPIQQLRIRTIIYQSKKNLSRISWWK